MTGVETIARIQFEHFQNCKGIKRIARELGIARDTVRKVLRSGAPEFSYKREVQPQLGHRSRANAGASLHPAAVRSWRSLSVRLEP